jgi:hypothetical protein
LTMFNRRYNGMRGLFINNAITTPAILGTRDQGIPPLEIFSYEVKLENGYLLLILIGIF